MGLISVGYPKRLPSTQLINLRKATRDKFTLPTELPTSHWGLAMRKMATIPEQWTKASVREDRNKQTRQATTTTRERRTVWKTKAAQRQYIINIHGTILDSKQNIQHTWKST
jgi:hypothetical protein